ncbi:MAG TPA: ABC transporter permease [Terracidiphilus sp.]|nr:ABC transporter permease [Terracidiphilus sp.]
MASQLSFTAFAWKNLWRRRLRTLLTLGGIGMAIGAFVGLVGFSRSFEHAWLMMYESSGTTMDVVQQSFLNTSVDQSDGARLRALPQVELAAPMILNLLSLSSDVNALSYGWKADSYEFQSLHILAGRRFRDGQPEVMLGDLLAQSLHKSPGDTIEIEGSPFTVVGVYHGESALEAGAVILPLDQMQKLGSLQGKVTAFHLRLKPPPPGVPEDRYLAQVSAEIEKMFPRLRAIPAAQRASNNQLVQLSHAAAWGTSLIALLIGILGIANTMAMSVFERTREIGILRALGWKQWRVMLLIQLEAATLGLAGGLLGMAIGFLALRVLALLPQTATVVSTSIPVALLAEALGIALLAGLVAGALPAWRGAQLSPVEALRHE